MFVTFVDDPLTGAIVLSLDMRVPLPSYQDVSIEGGARVKRYVLETRTAVGQRTPISFYRYLETVEREPETS